MGNSFGFSGSRASHNQKWTLHMKRRFSLFII
jgi:hypothetical protein